MKHTFSLTSSATKRKVVLTFVPSSPVSGTVQVKVTSSGKNVEIDALGVSAK